jgi:hypothetical protein
MRVVQYIILFLSIVPLRALAVEDYGDKLNNAQAAYQALNAGDKRAAVGLMHQGAHTSKAQDAFWNRVIDEAKEHGNVPVAVVAAEQKNKARENQKWIWDRHPRIAAMLFAALVGYAMYTLGHHTGYNDGLNATK